MGNSNGSLDKYVDAFFEKPALAGGFIWDWRDQGLAETDEKGRLAHTIAELPLRETSEVHIDAAMRGLGSASCGPDTLA